MKQLGRTLLRLIAIALATGLCMGLTAMYAHTIRPSTHRAGDRGERRRRPSAPNPGAIPRFIRQCGVFALLTLAGRKVLRLRL